MKPSDSATPKSDDKSPSTPTSTDTKIDKLVDLHSIDIAYAARSRKVGTLDAEIKKFKTALKTLLTSEKNKAVVEAQLSILRGFRRRDFTREDFYEHAILDRLTQLREME